MRLVKNSRVLPYHPIVMKVAQEVILRFLLHYKRFPCTINFRINPYSGGLDMKVVQIGAGLVGQLIATDLNQDFEVTVIDRNEQALDELRKKLPGIKTAVASATDPEELAPVVADADIVTAGCPGKIRLRNDEVCHIPWQGPGGYLFHAGGFRGS